jgi:VWFA-related protein
VKWRPRAVIAIVALLAAGFALFVTNAAAQRAPSSPQATFRTSTDVVQLDVSVLDKKRQPVGGLMAADFTILEDGKPRPIVAFDRFSSPRVERSSSWTDTVAADVVTNQTHVERFVVIMLDRMIPYGWPTVTARRLAAAIINQLGPNDAGAVIYSLDNATPQNFTFDRGRLLKAIESPALGLSLSAGAGAQTGDCRCGVCSLRAIQHVAEALADIPGRQKMLFFIGRAIAITEKPGTACPESEPATRDMFRAAHNANLVIHALDPGGLGGTDVALARRPGQSVIGGQSIQGSSESLRSLAEATGGRAVVNTNKPIEQVSDVFDESSLYYLLAFQRGEATSKNNFHKIEVQVKRKGVEVRTRKGYYSPGIATPVAQPAASEKETGRSLEESIRGTLPRRDFSLTLAVAPFALPGSSDAAVLVALDSAIPVNDDPPARAGAVPSDDSTIPASFEILATAFDTEGVAVVSQTNTASGGNGLGGRRFAEVLQLRLRPGRYEIRVAVNDVVSRRTGSVYGYADVPDFQGALLSLSGIVLQSPAPSYSSGNTAADIVPVLPSSQRSFASTDHLIGFLRVYQGDPHLPVTMTVQIMDATGKVVFSQNRRASASEFLPGNWIDCNFDFPLSRALPGDYLLTISATRGSNESTRRDVRFDVR